MVEAIFWMLVGAAIMGVCLHLYNNKKFREVIQEERESAERKIRAIKKGLEG